MTEQVEKVRRSPRSSPHKRGVRKPLRSALRGKRAFNRSNLSVTEMRLYQPLKICFKKARKGLCRGGSIHYGCVFDNAIEVRSIFLYVVISHAVAGLISSHHSENRAYNPMHNTYSTPKSLRF